MQVLDCWSFETLELRLTDISARLNITKPQVLRILNTLETGGYLHRDTESKRYRLGIRLFSLGMVAYRGMDLVRIVRPFLEHLVDETMETARLVVPDEEGPVCVAVVESPRGIRVFAQLGSRMPWNAGTSPKLLLAYLPEEVRELILKRGGFKRFTDQTITDPGDLRREVLKIREKGVCLSRGDLDRDALGVSAPVFDYQGHIAGAINVSAPAARISQKEEHHLVRVVREAGFGVSRELGYRRELPVLRQAHSDTPGRGRQVSAERGD
jgi:DNA-binding IclR family transcriptional regulator